MSTEQNKTLVRQFIEEFLNQGNVDLAKEIVAPDFIENEQLPPGMPQGREGVEMITTMLHTGFPDFRASCR
jgi:predicted SnoaL-like aldol condensation-catalyzing enzyme